MTHLPLFVLVFILCWLRVILEFPHTSQFGRENTNGTHTHRLQHNEHTLRTFTVSCVSNTFGATSSGSFRVEFRATRRNFDTDKLCVNFYTLIRNPNFATYSSAQIIESNDHTSAERRHLHFVQYLWDHLATRSAIISSSIFATEFTVREMRNIFAYQRFTCHQSSAYSLYTKCHHSVSHHRSMPPSSDWGSRLYSTDHLQCYCTICWLCLRWVWTTRSYESIHPKIVDTMKAKSYPETFSNIVAWLI